MNTYVLSAVFASVFQLSVEGDSLLE